jgi:ribosomal protein L14
MNSIVHCCDNTGIAKLRVIRIKGRANKRNAKIGDILTVVIKHINYKTTFFQEKNRKTKFKKGSIHRAILINSKKKFRRKNLSYI